MIIYFSSTGNCEYIAKKIAVATNDFAISIQEIKTDINLKNMEQLGIITPTYYWGLPSYVEEFLSKIKINNTLNSYIFYIATYGTTTGQADYFIKQLLKKQGIILTASFSIKTVDNWTVSFDLNNQEYIKDTLIKEEEQINQVIDLIKHKQRIYITKDKKSLFMCKNARFYYNKARKTKHLHVTNNCIGCGLCEKNCPINAIKIVDGKPTWVLKQCIMCFGCLHRCPKFAIQYDNKTQKHGQYIHPKYQN